jgi:hypothetical protein
LNERFEQYINGKRENLHSNFTLRLKKILWEARSTPTLAPTIISARLVSACSSSSTVGTLPFGFFVACPASMIRMQNPFWQDSRECVEQQRVRAAGFSSKVRSANCLVIRTIQQQMQQNFCLVSCWPLCLSLTEAVVTSRRNFVCQLGGAGERITHTSRIST